jgi:MscS family membrane protein
MDQVNECMEFVGLSWTATVESGFIVLLAGTLAFFLRDILYRMGAMTSKHSWIKAFGEALLPHYKWVIWTYAAFAVCQAYLRRGEWETALSAINTGKSLFLVSAATFIFLSWKKRIEKMLMARVHEKGGYHPDLALIPVVGKLISSVMFLIFGLMVLDVFQVPLQAILAFGGLGSLAVSWAAKDVIANFFGGFTIFINRHFHVGDWIRSTNKEFEGVVEEIGWYMTQIRSLDRRPTYIPNSQITDAIVENPGRMYNRRIKTIIHLRHDDIDKVEEVVGKIRMLVKSHPEIDHNLFRFIHLVKVSEWSLDIELSMFTKTIEWEKFLLIQEEILLKVVRIIRECGAELAHPLSTVHLKPASVELPRIESSQV